MLNFFQPLGLTYQMNSLMIINTVIPPIILIIFNFEDIVKWWYKRKIIKFMNTGEGEPYCQGEANENFVGSEFPFADIYVYMFSTLGTCLFYLSTFPIVVIYAVIALIICFLANKVNNQTSCDSLFSSFFLLCS